MIRRALISVSNKEGIIEFAKGLQEKDIEIISTGGTAKALADAGIAVTKVEDVTEFPECFSGRVKTMHPLILGGLLFRRGDKEHEKQARKLDVKPIDLVVVNLYPFEEYKEKEDKDDKEDKDYKDGVELIDVGGPTMLRSAAKNFESVTVVCDPADYDLVLLEIQSKGDTTPELRRELAAKVFLRTAAYDGAITEWLSNGQNKGILLTDKWKLRYGENPHQEGAFYERYSLPPAFTLRLASLAQGQARQIVCNESHRSAAANLTILQQEKPISYLNLLDADAAWNLVMEFSEPTAACIKHANPSGVASNIDIAEAFQRAYDTDRLSAFGVIIALNRPCTAAVVKKMIDQKIFAEVIIAPGYDDAAKELLKHKPKVRVIEMNSKIRKFENSKMCRCALGGVLVQDEDERIVTEDDLTVVTSKKPTPAQVQDMLFAWKVVKYAKSNAIVFAKDKVTVGIGCGQTSRVDSTWIAAKRAGDRAKGAVMASDAFFPFPDSVEEAAKHGIAAIIQPGGSVKDQEVFAKAETLGISMVTTGIRAFRH